MFYFNLNKKKKRKEKVYKLYRNKNSITITNGKIYRCVRNYDRIRRKKKERKKKKVQKISKGATFQTPFKLFTSKFYKETYAQTFPRLSKFSSLLSSICISIFIIFSFHLATSNNRDIYKFSGYKFFNFSLFPSFKRWIHFITIGTVER